MIPLLLITAVLGATAPVPVARVDTTPPVVALTFDACATKGQPNRFDQAVFDILKQRGVPMTVFLSGRWIETHSDAARVLANEPWVEIGNHTWDHPRLSQLSEDLIAQEIDRATAAIAQLGRTPVALRPPAGDWNDTVARIAAARGLPLVLWDVVSGDVDGAVPASRIVATVTKEVRPGSIVIFHINGRGRFTKDALPAIIDALQARGFQFVTLSQLLAVPDGRVVVARPHAYALRHHVTDRRSAGGDAVTAHH